VCLRRRLPGIERHSGFAVRFADLSFEPLKSRQIPRYGLQNTFGVIPQVQRRHVPCSRESRRERFPFLQNAFHVPHDELGQSHCISTGRALRGWCRSAPRRTRPPGSWLPTDRASVVPRQPHRWLGEHTPQWSSRRQRRQAGHPAGQPAFNIVQESVQERDPRRDRIRETRISVKHSVTRRSTFPPREPAAAYHGGDARARCSFRSRRDDATPSPPVGPSLSSSP